MPSGPGTRCCPRCGEVRASGWTRHCWPHHTDMTPKDRTTLDRMWVRGCLLLRCKTCRSVVHAYDDTMFILSTVND